VKWVDAIEAATNRNDLQYLTLLPLRYMFQAACLTGDVRGAHFASNNGGQPAR